MFDRWKWMPREHFAYLLHQTGLFDYGHLANKESSEFFKYQKLEFGHWLLIRISDGFMLQGNREKLLQWVLSNQIVIIPYAKLMIPF